MSHKRWRLRAEEPESVAIEAIDNSAIRLVEWSVWLLYFALWLGLFTPEFRPRLYPKPLYGNGDV